MKAADKSPVHAVAVAFLAIALLAPSSPLSADRPPTAVPKELADSTRDLGRWLNSLLKKSPDQIAQQLGPATERQTWEFRDKQELLLVYELASTPKSTLRLYFLGDRLIKASFQQMSD